MPDALLFGRDVLFGERLAVDIALLLFSFAVFAWRAVHLLHKGSVEGAKGIEAYDLADLGYGEGGVDQMLAGA